MELFNNLIYVKNPLEDIIIYNERQYYRYMNKIYIPNPPCDLDDNDVSSLSKIRIILNGDVIDYEYTESIISYLVDKSEISDNEDIIDFGCGGGILADVLLKTKRNLKNVIGLDLCSFAVQTANEIYKDRLSKGCAFLFNNDKKIPMNDESADAIISSFVMHFNIYPSQIDELYRVLKKGKKFIYNDYVYNKYPGHAKKLVKQLEDKGFSIEKEVVEFKIPSESIIKKHLIVTATK